MNQQKKEENRTPSSHSDADIDIDSKELLQGRRMVVINHRGEQYRLIETRNGKLILQK